jgi:3-oxoacyl-[acyl-carrier protein] reductase
MNDDKTHVVVVSGGSRGLGQAIVADFHARGYIVATFSRSPTPFTEGLLRNDPEGSTWFWEQIDGTDCERVQQFVLKVARRYGRIDVLVNNAAAAGASVLALMRPEEIHRQIAVNLEAPVTLTQSCARVMLAQESGNIISISSVNALRGHAGVSLYGATKAALDGLTRNLARELGPRGIRVNSLAPGYFKSDMTRSLTDEQQRMIVRRTPLGRLATVADIVAVVRFLAGPESAMMTGQTLVVDGGLTC